MNEAAIRKGLGELSIILTEKPAGLVSSPTKDDGVYLPCAAARDGSIEEAFEHLRVLVKYLVFDLEATRRENRYLRQMLESRFHRDREQGRDEDPGGPE